MIFYAWFILLIVYILFPQVFITFSIRDIAKEAFPILFVPYLNKLLNNISKRQYVIFLLMSFMFYSVLPTLKMTTYLQGAGMVFLL